MVITVSNANRENQDSCGSAKTQGHKTRKGWVLDLNSESEAWVWLQAFHRNTFSLAIINGQRSKANISVTINYHLIECLVPGVEAAGLSREPVLEKLSLVKGTDSCAMLGCPCWTCLWWLATLLDSLEQKQRLASIKAFALPSDSHPGGFLPPFLHTGKALGDRRLGYKYIKLD